MRTDNAEGRLASGSSGSSPASERVLRRSLPFLRTYRRRRRILVHSRYQIRAALMGVTGMGFLVILTVLLLQRTQAVSSRILLEKAPLLAEMLSTAHHRQILLVAAGGALFMAGVFLAAILESRRTAGPVFNLQRRMEELRSGRLGARVILRRQDNFPELAEGFNGMAASIRSRTEGDLATLGRLAGQVSDLMREEGRGNRQGVLRIAETLRQSLEDARRRKAELLEP